MPRIKIKQLDHAIATSGIFMGGDGRRRKLQPGEIVDVPEDLKLEDGRPLFDMLWQTGKIEITPEPPTRPLDFATETEARITAPTFKSRGPDQDREIAQAWADIRARMAKEAAQDAAPAPVAETPAAPPATEKVASAPGNRRAARRAAAGATSGGQAAT